MKDIKKIRLGPKEILFPMPTSLIGCGTANKPNIITVAWIGIMSATPPTVAISLSKTRYSLELIKDTKEFTVNIPSSEIFAEADYCGIVSGRKTEKFKDCNFTHIKGTRINAPIIKECPVNLECVVIKELDICNRIIFFGEILETLIDDDKYDTVSKNPLIDKINPISYYPKVKEYRAVGDKIGNAFKSGKTVLTKKL